MRRLLISVLLLALMLQLSEAQISTYAVDASLQANGYANVKISITFDDPNITSFQFYVFANIESFSYDTTGESIFCFTEKELATKVICNFKLTEEGKTITINYATKDYVKNAGDQLMFNGDFSLEGFIKSAFIVVRLPEGMVLVNPDSYFPSDGRPSSDGKHIIVIWRYTDINNQPLVFKLFYEPSVKINYTPYFLLAVFVLFVVYVVYVKYVRQRHRIISRVLDKYEQAVYEIVKREGRIDQRKVVALTNFSKARVSRIVKSLKERGLIKVERRGRTNILEIA